MGWRVCIEVGCGELTQATRCDDHRRAKDAARGRRQARGYGAAHDRLRADYQRRMDSGERFVCWRCEALGEPHDVDPRAWRLGHCDIDRGTYHGPECIPGNQATSGRRGCPHPGHRTGVRISPGA